MKFKLGDFVRFVEESRQGYITRIIDEQTVGVTDEDDFEIPVLATKITYIFGHPSNVKNPETIDLNNIDSTSDFKTEGFFLAVADDQRASSVVHFYLINETSFKILVNLRTEKLEKFKGEFAGVLLPKTQIKVYSASLSELDAWPTFTTQALFFTEQNIKTANTLVIQQRFKAKDFSGAKKHIAILNQHAWEFQLDKPVPLIDAQKLKESFFKTPEEKVLVEKPSKEVDLHIEKLRDDHQFLSKQEMLDHQLQFFHKSLDAAIVHKLTSIIFIHGVGNGTLRHEIHKTISMHAQVKTFMDARKEKFGYGATEVIFK